MKVAEIIQNPWASSLNWRSSSVNWEPLLHIRETRNSCKM